MSNLDAWERKLQGVFNEIDDDLEDTYGERYPLHPNRPRRGKTASKSHDGLFNVGAAYSAGYGSELGEGYVVDVHLSTLKDVPDHVRKEIEDAVVALLKEKLPEAFPGRNLQVRRDGNVYKIIGDLDLEDR